MHLLRDRGDDLDAAGIRPFGISRDSAWSHRAWAETLGVDVPLLSDWNGDATRAFDVSFEPLGMQDVPSRSAFLVRDGETIEAAWMLGGELPDLDAVIAVTVDASPGSAARGSGDRAATRANPGASRGGA
jgi:peroxiredoxin